MKDNEIAVIEKENALTVFSKDNGLDPYLLKIKQEVELFIPDVTTKKGRDEIASMAYKVTKSKTYLDGLGKDLVAEMKEIPKKIDAERKRMRDTLDQLRDDVRKPLTQWEEQQEIKAAEIQGAIEGIASYGNMDGLCAADIANNIDLLELIKVDEWYGDFQVQALLKKESILVELRAELPKRRQHEMEQEELARLRKEAAERERIDNEQRIAREAAEQARLEAEKQAQQEMERVESEARRVAQEAAQREAYIKDQAEKRELELQLQLEKSKRAAAEAIEKAAAEVAAEEQRKQQERDAELEQQRKRELDRDHRAKVNNEAVSSFLALGMTEQMAKQAVTAISRKLIKNVTINY